VSMKVRDVSWHHANWMIAATAGRSGHLAMPAMRRSMFCLRGRRRGRSGGRRSPVAKEAADMATRAQRLHASA
jgi:hypothetical protein